ISNTSFPNAGGKLLPVVSNTDGLANLEKTLQNLHDADFTVIPPLSDSDSHSLRLKLATVFGKMKPTDLIFIYYSGRFICKRSEKLGFATFDTTHQEETDGFMEFTYLSFEEIARLIDPKNPRRVFLLADTDSPIENDEAINELLSTFGFRSIISPINH